jgi:hypothetical protein
MDASPVSGRGMGFLVEYSELEMSCQIGLGEKGGEGGREKRGI